MVYEDELATLRTQLTAAHRERDDAREKVAAWMIAHSYATGHGDTIDDLLAELSGHIKSERARCAELDEMLEASHVHIAQIEAETIEKCAKVAEALRPRGGRAWDVKQASCYAALTDAAEDIRALTSPPTPNRSEG
jgi:uncharacterized protein with von Willebrand factor type A (vWA) domain